MKMKMITMMTVMNAYLYGLGPIELIILQSTQLTNHDKPSSPMAVIPCDKKGGYSVTTTLRRAVSIMMRGLYHISNRIRGDGY